MSGSNIKQAVEYANYRYYSKPMTVVNLNYLQLPITTPLTQLTSKEGYSFNIRSSHGLLHTTAAMELIDKIHATYAEHLGERYTSALDEIAKKFKVSCNKLVKLIQIAALFHDSAREGDGMDLWDPQSADACKQFLINEWEISEELAQFIADTIRYKDDPQNFVEAYQSIHGDVDFVRQLVNMADTLEVIRTRDVFKPEYMPIANYISPKMMATRIIPELVVPHRQLIIDQGRLSKDGRIEYTHNEFRYDDSNYAVQSGKDSKKMAEAYLQKSHQYDLSVLEIDQNNLDLVFDRALRGIHTYLDEHKTAGIQFFHNGFFSPRYHGKLGFNRAMFYEQALAPSLTKAEKTKALYALFASKDGSTLKEAVLRSFNQTNEALVLSQLSVLVKQPSLDSGVPLHQLNEEIKSYVWRANGIQNSEVAEPVSEYQNR